MHGSTAARGATGCCAAVRGQRRDVVGSALLAVGHQLSEAAVPVVVGVVLDRAVGTGDGSALALWLAVVVGVFVVLASCGAIGYWLMDRARLRAGRDVRVRVAGAGARPGWAERPGGPASWSAWPAPTPTGAARSSPRTPGWPAPRPRWLPAVPCCSRPRRCWPGRAGRRPRRAGRVPAVGPAAGRPGRGEQATLAAATGAATDLVTGLRVLKGIGAEPAAGSGVRAGQPDRAAGPAGRGDGPRAATSGATTALTGLLLVVVAWVGGRLALAGDDQHRRAGGRGRAGAVPARAAGALTRLGPLVAGARGAAGRVATLLAAPPAVHAR